MKYILFSALVLLATACRFQSKTGSGNVVTEKRTVKSFTSVHAENMVSVDITKGTEQSVTVEADDNILPYIMTNVSGDVLRVTLRDIHSLTNATIHIHIVTASLTGLSASASADIISKDTLSSANKITIEASSSGSVKAILDAPEVDIEGSSSADIRLSGRTRSISAEANSSADIDASGLSAENAKADASSSATIKIFASISVNAQASSSGTVRYTGGATNVVKNESSSGSVEAGR